jgi:carbon storage regulator
MSLVVTRKNGQTIMVGDNVVITVYAGTTVKLAIDAPRDVKVLRGELERKEEKA